MKRYFSFLLSYYLLLLPAIALAQVPGGSDPGGGLPTPSGSGGTGAGVKIQNPLGSGTTLAGLFKTLLEIVLVFAIPITVFFIIYAGFLYVTARGNAEQVSRAHRALLYALIGGVLILGGNILIDVVQNTVNAIKN